MLKRFGRMPKRGEQLSFDNLSFKVLRADSRRLHLLLVEKIPRRNKSLQHHETRARCHGVRGSGARRMSAGVTTAPGDGAFSRPQALAFAALAGAATVLGFAPFYLFPLPVATLALLIVLWQRAPSRRNAALIGFSFGLGYFLAGVSWVYVSLHDFGAMPALAGWHPDPVVLRLSRVLPGCHGLDILHARRTLDARHADGVAGAVDARRLAARLAVHGFSVDRARLCAGSRQPARRLCAGAGRLRRLVCDRSDRRAARHADYAPERKE